MVIKIQLKVQAMELPVVIIMFLVMEMGLRVEKIIYGVITMEQQEILMQLKARAMELLEITME